MKIDKIILENLYIKEKKTCKEIASFFNTSIATISRELKRQGIKARPFTEKGRTSWNKGLPLSEDTKKLLSLARKGKPLLKEHRDKVVKHLNSGLVGSNNHNWKGGKYTAPAGYVYLRIKDHPNVLSNGYVPEHRFIMEQKLGRYLTKWEHVHHINRDKKDNNPDNLELVNAHTHNLITMMEIEITRLNQEIKVLKEQVSLLTNTS